MLSKTLFAVALSILCIGACKKNNSGDYSNAVVAGKWKLLEYYMDPGDGSGTWQPAHVLQQPVYAEFKWNGYLSLDGTFLSGYNRYTIASDSTLWLYTAMQQDSTLIMFTKTANLLTLRPTCFEGCGFRYKKVSL